MVLDFHHLFNVHQLHSAEQTHPPSPYVCNGSMKHCFLIRSSEFTSSSSSTFSLSLWSGEGELYLAIFSFTSAVASSKLCHERGQMKVCDGTQAALWMSVRLPPKDYNPTNNSLLSTLSLLIDGWIGTHTVTHSGLQMTPYLEHICANTGTDMFQTSSTIEMCFRTLLPLPLS